MKTLLPLACLILISIFSLAQNTQKRTIVSGKLKGDAYTNIFLKTYFTMLGFIESIEKSSGIDKNGNFRFEIEIDEPTLTRLFTNEEIRATIGSLSLNNVMMAPCANFYRESIELLISPGDSIFVEADQKIFDDYYNTYWEGTQNEMIKISGTNAYSKNYLQNYVYPRPLSKKLFEIRSNENIDTAFADLEQLKNEMNVELEADKGKLDKVTCNFRKNTIEYCCLNEKASCVLSKTLTNDISDSIANIYLQKIFTTPPEDNKLAKNILEYWLYIRLYVEYSIGGASALSNGMMKFFPDRFMFANETLKGKAKYFYHTTFLNLIEDLNSPEIKLLYDFYLQEYPSGKYNHVITDRFIAKKKTEKGNTALDFKFNDLNGKIVELKNFSDKFIFIHIFDADDDATGALIEYYEKLIASFDDNKISFIFINRETIENIPATDTLKGIYCFNQDLKKTGLSVYSEIDSQDSFLINKDKTFEDRPPFIENPRFKYNLQEVIDNM